MAELSQISVDADGIPDAAGTDTVPTLTPVRDILGAAADAASTTTTIKAALRGIATALGITALDLGSGTGGARTLRFFRDTAQWMGGAGNVSSATQRVTLAGDDPAVVALQKQSSGNAAVSITRTADTNAYAANDVIGAATGSTAAIEFTSMGPSAGRVMITSASIEIDAAAVISGETSYMLHLYNVTPPSALGDNAAHDLPSGDRASYLGTVFLGTPQDLGSTLFVQTDGINKQIKLAGTSIFGYLVTVGAHTPTSARVHVVTLHTVSV